MKISSKLDLRSASSGSEVFNKLLDLRGYKTQKEKLAYLKPPNPTLETLIEELSIDTSALNSIGERITKAIESEESICIYGDYDTDGVTATSILYRSLTSIGARVLPFIPHREKHGYGMSTKSLKEILSGSAFAASPLHPFKPSLIITVDNGIVAHKEVLFLKENSVDVIITDHHQIEGEPPAADHILHSTASSASVLSWTLSLFLTESSRVTLNMIDLAAVGLIADQLPLTGINRGVAKHGLIQLANTTNIGLKSLIREAKIEKDNFSSYDVGFLIAPRINAAGRLRSATDALRLLCTDNAKTAATLAKALDSINLERQNMTSQALSSIKESDISSKIITVVSDAYHEGIIGLIAGRILEETGKPAVVITTSGEVAKGSARAPKGVNITDLLRTAKSYTLSLGGHAAAAGFSIKHDQISSFVNAITEESDTIDPELLIKSLSVDATLSFKQLSLNLAKLLGSMEPFGIGNPKPKFMTSEATIIESDRVGGDNKHLRLTLDEGGKSQKAIWFNAPEGIESDLNTVDIIYTLGVNDWNNKQYLNIVISYAKKI